MSQSQKNENALSSSFLLNTDRPKPSQKALFAMGADEEQQKEKLNQLKQRLKEEEGFTEEKLE